jgi:hypothetical protein
VLIGRKVASRTAGLPAQLWVDAPTVPA